MTRKLALLAALAAGAALVFMTVAAPAVALETTTFGIDVVESSEDGRLRIPIKAGEVATGELRVWNKQDTPLVLRLSVVPAEVADDGTATLGGDDEAVAWLEVPARVELAVGAEQRVRVQVSAPRELTGETKTVAVLATPEQEGEAPAVLQRLAVTTYLVPEEGSLIASLGWLPWIAVLVLAVAVALVVRRIRHRLVH